MKTSLALLSLANAAARVYGHPTHGSHVGHGRGLTRRTVDLDAFRLPVRAEYVDATSVAADPPASGGLVPSSYVDTATNLVKLVAPDAEFRVVTDHYVGTNGVAHVYFKQTMHGLDIDNGDFNVNIGVDGNVFSYGNNFYRGPTPEEPLTKRDVSDPVDAVKAASDKLQLPVDASNAEARQKAGMAETYSIEGTSGASQTPEARLVYLIKGDGELVLTWRIETDIVDNWLLTFVDAKSNNEIHGVVDYVADVGTYLVYPWGTNDPGEGDRVVVEDPWYSPASEFTWQGDGTTVWDTTRGNNGIAQNNPSGASAYLNNYRPESATREFEYAYDPSMSNPSDYVNASITQLFYTANKYHDLLYVLGFNEAAGNFEVDNNGAGGKGNDQVILNAQDGSGTNNANFATPPDGQNPRMRMYLFTRTTPRRDCTFEAGVVIHEYTHGLSFRLTGGPANSNCLGSTEAGGMGEGWGDFMATAVRLKTADTRATDYPMGEWVLGDPRGIRTYPYSTSMETNPLIYTDANTRNEVHALGEIWANMLYELVWNLIEKHGKNDDDLPVFDAKGVPTDGKYLTMKLVVDAMALQPCNPNMVQARDAILDADKALTGAGNRCEIWAAFAKRGLGVGAIYSSSKRVGSFEKPANC